MKGGTGVNNVQIVNESSLFNSYSIVYSLERFIVCVSFFHFIVRFIECYFMISVGQDFIQTSRESYFKVLETYMACHEFLNIAAVFYEITGACPMPGGRVPGPRLAVAERCILQVYLETERGGLYTSV